jgi:hypothetical protein
VFANDDYELLDLLDFSISPYSYLNSYSGTDEFLKVIDELVKHQVIVFATLFIGMQ